MAMAILTFVAKLFLLLRPYTSFPHTDQLQGAWPALRFTKQGSFQISLFSDQHYGESTFRLESLAYAL